MKKRGAEGEWAIRCDKSSQIGCFSVIVRLLQSLPFGPYMAAEIYVAGGYKHRNEIREFVDQLEATGLYKQSRRWFDVESDSETPAQSAAADLEAVRNASLVVAVMTDPDYAYRGTWTEVGAALALRKSITIIGPDSVASARNVFWYAPEIRHVPSTQVFLNSTINEARRRKAEPSQ